MIYADVELKINSKNGNEKNVVVLTQHRGFVKKPSSNRYPARVVYRKYPNFVRAMENRHNMYNDETRLCYEMEKAGKAYIIQPEKPVKKPRQPKTAAVGPTLADLYQPKPTGDDPVLAALEGICSLEELSARCGMDTTALLGRLTLLELQGKVRQLPGQTYEKV